jgi:hypothetical protein
MDECTDRTRGSLDLSAEEWDRFVRLGKGIHVSLAPRGNSTATDDHAGPRIEVTQKTDPRDDHSGSRHDSIHKLSRDSRVSDSDGRGHRRSPHWRSVATADATVHFSARQSIFTGSSQDQPPKHPGGRPRVGPNCRFSKYVKWIGGYLPSVDPDLDCTNKSDELRDDGYKHPTPCKLATKYKQPCVISSTSSGTLSLGVKRSMDALARQCLTDMGYVLLTATPGCSREEWVKPGQQSQNV